MRGESLKENSRVAAPALVSSLGRILGNVKRRLSALISVRCAVECPMFCHYCAQECGLSNLIRLCLW